MEPIGTPEAPKPYTLNPEGTPYNGAFCYTEPPKSCHGAWTSHGPLSALIGRISLPGSYPKGLGFRVIGCFRV